MTPTPVNRARWYQFRLRTLLVLIALIAGVLVWARGYLDPFNRQRQTMELVERLGGSYETSPPQKWQAWYFGRDYQNLVHVNLADHDRPEDYLAAIAALPRLETLAVGGEAFGDEHLGALRGTSSLRRLVLDSTSVSDEALAAWREAAPQVEVYQSQRRIIAALRKRKLPVLCRRDPAPTIPTVGAEYFEQPDGVRPEALKDADTWALLHRLRGLRIVDFTYFRGDMALEHVQGMTELKQLQLGQSPASDADLAHVQGLTKLAILTLDGTRVTDEGLVHLAGLRGLKLLTLHDSLISDEGLTHLSGLTGLERLSLSSSRVGDAGMAALSTMARLKDLDLSATKVTDDGLAHLKALPNLNVLSLIQTQVSDAGLVHLEGAARLQRLSVRDTKVTPAGVARLQKALPDCQIIAQ